MASGPSIPRDAREGRLPRARVWGDAQKQFNGTDSKAENAGSIPFTSLI